MTENVRVGLFFAKTGSINSGTGLNIYTNKLSKKGKQFFTIIYMKNDKI